MKLLFIKHHKTSQYTAEDLNRIAVERNYSERYDTAMCLESDSDWIKWFRMSTFVSGYSLPLIVITCCYGAVLRQLYIKSKVKIKTSNKQDNMLNKVTKIVVVLVSLIIVFIQNINNKHSNNLLCSTA